MTRRTHSGGEHVVRSSTSWLLLTCSCFAAGGVASRCFLQLVETRMQILGAWAVAVAVHILSRRLRLGSSNGALLLNGAAATVAIVCTKFALEGVPRLLRH